MSSNYYRDKGPGTIPARWINCPRKSVLLAGNKFLVFKTPLSHKFDDQVPLQNQFTPGMLFNSMKSHKVKIGLWIDLTNTSRFYDRSEIEDEGVKYVKIQCRGHGECPSVEQVTTFVELCSMYIKKNPLDIIAVHCTHGFNRSGFMICSYFVTEEDWSCDFAVREFARVRPPGIYKQDYLQALYSRFDEIDNIPIAPSLPDWSKEEFELFDDGDEESNPPSNSFNNHSRGKFKKEKINKNATFMEGVSGVSLLVDNKRRISIQKRIQDCVGWRSTGFPGCQPISMTVDNIKLLSGKPYHVSWKADGARYMMFIDGKGENYFADRDFNIFFAPDVEFREKRDLNKYLYDTLLDGEMVIDIDRRTNKTYPRYLIYDAVRIQGRDIMYDNFHMRFERIKTDIINPRYAAIERGLINKTREPFGVRRKDFWFANPENTAKLLSEKFKEQLWHEPDGLIFQPEPDPYVPGRCDAVLKWKPSSHNSVDFRVKIVTKTGIGLLPTTTAELYVGGYDPPFGSMKASKTIKELDKKIIECKFQENKWVFMRERTDKSFPNSLKTAQGVADSILRPVTEDMLIHYLRTHGFKRPDSELMPPPKKIKF